ncbi:putative Histidine phosphatase superfamily [Seiridium cardinale]|uniref:Histidine phosphatase superfamily n=1 Tax=Seiridium cardinale TaxID=138064 RepID=A0ABR2XI66_9PEZI
MAPSGTKTILTLLLTCGASVQAAETVWTAFAYVLNGERTPLLAGTSAGSLTSVGANQMLSQGSLLRTRWLDNTTLSGDSSNITTNAPIVGIQKTAIDNSQLSIYSSRDQYVTAGALAFMQGLYPPRTQAFAPGNGGLDAAVLANGSLVEFPFDGYMYPNIRTVSLSEPESVWLEGHVTCTEYLKATSDLRSDHRIAEKYNTSYPQYQKLWSTVFNGTFPLAAATFEYAYELYDYASYQYTHNKTIRDALHADELDWLAEFASIQQFAKNGDLSVSGRNNGDMIRAISGRTLAATVIEQFQEHITTGGESPKLNLVFGSFEPMLSFFALSNLSTGHSSGTFQDLPQPGGAMIFELFSEGTDTSNMPGVEDLWIRFLYRNGTAADTPVYEYPLFDLGNSETRLKYKDFASHIQAFSINSVSEWCTTCDAVSTFCSTTRQTLDGDSTSSTNSNNLNLSPAVAGVIGACMTIAVIAVVAVSLVVFGGFVVHRNSPSRKSNLAGFKGPEKMASDKDLTVAKNGARHERVGSWELGGPGRPVVGDSKDEPVFGATHMRNIDDDGDSIIMGREPVNPRESV